MTIMLMLAAAFLLSLLGTYVLIGVLRRKQIYDLPNDRSNHTIPTPRGGGLVITSVLMLGIVIFSQQHAMWGNWPHLMLTLCMLLLAGISFADDVKNLPISIRFGAQLCVIIIGLAYFPADLFIFQGLLPFALDRVLAAIAWLWFINLYNFMDGIDGMAGSETIAIGLGIALLAGLPHLPAEFTFYSLLIAASTAGFLVWNWHPAKIFMGDVGSIPLGYILGWLLLMLAAHGYWAAALILPSYYLADSSLTLIKRLLRGKKIWQAHSEHFYQQAVRAGKSHSEVVKMITGVNLLLIGLALISTLGNVYAWGSIFVAICLVAGLLRYFYPSEKI